MGRLPLFAAIAIWAVLGIIAFLLAMWWLGRVPPWQLKLDPRKQAENIVKIALTLVGGVGAVAYLVIKYQERQQAGRAEKREKDRIVDTKVQAAINQLGSDKASTRIAGVYALTDIADRYKGGYRQRVVDILCGYLRSDRANYALDELGQPVKNASGHLVKSGASDEGVESTILSVMRDRLRKERRNDKTGKPSCKRWMMTSCGALARSISMEPHSTKPWTSRIPLSNVSHTFAEPNSNAARTSARRTSQASRTSSGRTSQATRTSSG
nr:hypothetical protein [Bifidobacterium ruminantium]